MDNIEKTIEKLQQQLIDEYESMFIDLIDFDFDRENDCWHEHVLSTIQGMPNIFECNIKDIDSYLYMHARETAEILEQERKEDLKMNED